MIEVTTTRNATGQFAEVKTGKSHLSVLVNPGETPAAALQRLATESRVKAARLIALAQRCEAGADVLLTPAG